MLEDDLIENATAEERQKAKAEAARVSKLYRKAKGLSMMLDDDEELYL